MKKNLIIFVMALMSFTAASAQFDQGTWFFNASMKGLDFNHDKQNGNTFRFDAGAGNFIADNFAVKVDFGADLTKYYDQYNLGTQARYYYSSCGIYTGLGLSYGYRSLDIAGLKDTVHLMFLSPEVGYAFYLSHYLTVEPAVYYNICTNKFDECSNFGFKIGFGYYF